MECKNDEEDATSEGHGALRDLGRHQATSDNRQACTPATQLESARRDFQVCLLSGDLVTTAALGSYWARCLHHGLDTAQ